MPVDKRTDIWAFGCVALRDVDRARDVCGRHGLGLDREDPRARAGLVGASRDDASLDPTAAAPLSREGSEEAPARYRRRPDRDRRRRGGRFRAPTTTPAPLRRRAVLGRWLPWVALAALAVAVGAWQALRPVLVENPLPSEGFKLLTDWAGSEASRGNLARRESRRVPRRPRGRDSISFRVSWAPESSRT